MILGIASIASGTLLLGTPLVFGPPSSSLQFFMFLAVGAVSIPIGIGAIVYGAKRKE
jgi:hypothetical protein